MDRVSSDWVITEGLREVREHPYHVIIGELIERVTGHAAIWEIREAI